MTSTLTHPLVSAYLRDLELLLHGVDPGERAEVLAGVHEHLDASLVPGASDEDVRTVLAELGSAHAVADEAYAGRPPSAVATAQRTSPWTAFVAIAINAACILYMMVLLIFGVAGASAMAFGVVLFLLPWSITCLLTVASSGWSGHEKLTSVLVLPGTLLAHVVALSIALRTIGPHIVNLVATVAISAIALWLLGRLASSGRR